MLQNFKNHCSLRFPPPFFATQKAAVEAAGYEAGAGFIKLDYSRALPTDLLKALMSRRPSAAAFPARVESPPLSNAEFLYSAVTAAVSGHSWSVARRGDVVVNGGVAHLWGVVPSTNVLDAYRNAAAKVPGIKSVEVHMHVLPAS